MAKWVAKSRGGVDIDARRINSGDHIPINTLPQPERIVEKMGVVSGRDAVIRRRHTRTLPNDDHSRKSGLRS